MVLLLVLLLGLSGQLQLTWASCHVGKLNSTRTGHCVTYPSTGLCASGFAGRRVWLANDTSLPQAEFMVKTSLELLVKNSELIQETTCIAATEKFLCARQYPNCLEVGEEKIPQLFCQDGCEEYWSKCQQTFNLYYITLVQTLKVVSIEEVNTIHCGAGTFTIPGAGQPSDVFGVREIPNSPTWMEGWSGALRFPPGPATFSLQNGTDISLDCATMPNLSARVPTELECSPPLVNTIENGTITCKLPWYAVNHPQCDRVH